MVSKLLGVLALLALVSLGMADDNHGKNWSQFSYNGSNVTVYAPDEWEFRSHGIATNVVDDDRTVNVAACPACSNPVNKVIVKEYSVQKGPTKYPSWNNWTEKEVVVTNGKVSVLLCGHTECVDLLVDHIVFDKPVEVV
jgi:hypothetical protein